ncbi:hypothetical protein K432DRAFT_236466 [Lepidopterella palustris CBS 459.81]|uniref:Uncharacterized protein n=1 Tax=Lepidopterella palustris CBS 459.81 TaxID=1314670 RepID=A0A8E2J8N9_9PEZI|nr:hypothetical protein K432DRAFT_236466 [Lepidopterella palustris CBS 459.81]
MKANCGIVVGNTLSVSGALDPHCHTRWKGLRDLRPRRAVELMMLLLLTFSIFYFSPFYLFVATTSSQRQRGRRISGPLYAVQPAIFRAAVPCLRRALLPAFPPSVPSQRSQHSSQHSPPALSPKRPPPLPSPMRIECIGHS